MTLNNIKLMLKTHPFLLGLLFITQVLLSVLVLFSYGVYQNNLYDKRASETPIKLIEIDLSEADSASMVRTIKSHLTDAATKMSPGFSHFFLYGTTKYTNEIVHRYENEIIEIDGVNIDDMDGLDCAVRAAAFVDGNEFSDDDEYSGMIEGGRWFSREELNSGEKVCFGPTIARGKTSIMIAGQEYRVLGNDGMDYDSIWVTPLSYPEIISHLILEIVYDRQILQSEYEKDTAYWEELLGITTEKVSNYATLSIEEKATWKSMMLIAAAMGMVSTLVTCIIYAFLQKEREKSTAVYEICGCTRFRAVLIYLGEMFFILILAAVSGYLLFYRVVLKKTEPYLQFFRQIFSDRKALLLTVFSTALVFVCMSIMIILSTSKTPRQLLKEAD